MRSKMHLVRPAALLCALALLLTGCASSRRMQRLVVGTYTMRSSAQGVYLYSVNPRNADTRLLSCAPSGNPSFVTVSSDRKYVYAVNEFHDGREGLSAFWLEGDSLRPVQRVLFKDAGVDGRSACNILQTGNALVSSNYSGGTVAAYALADDGRIGGLLQSFGREGARMHCAVPSPDGKYLFVCNLGNDCVHRFEPGAEGPLCKPVTAWQNEDPVRFGPRHMVFSPDGRFACLLCELGDRLVVFRYEDGVLTPIQTLMAYDGEGHASADIHFSPDGRVLYPSHRRQKDGIAIFSVDRESGLVTPVGYQKTGAHPRNFAISPDGRFLLCACRDSNCIEIYSVDRRSGALRPSGKSIRVGAPVCVQFTF